MTSGDRSSKARLAGRAQPRLKPCQPQERSCRDTDIQLERRLAPIRQANAAGPTDTVCTLLSTQSVHTDFRERCSAPLPAMLPPKTRATVHRRTDSSARMEIVRVSALQAAS